MQVDDRRGAGGQVGAGAADPDALRGDRDLDPAGPSERVALLDRPRCPAGIRSHGGEPGGERPAAVPVAGSSAMPTVGLKNLA